MRLFTVAEANALIPRLEELFARLGRLRDQAQPSRERLLQLEQIAHANGANHTEEARALRLRIESLAGEMNAVLQEIASLGCEVKDVDEGLVDFPHRREGRIVYLCWKRGEDRIRFWHELSAGFAGRQPLPDDE